MSKKNGLTELLNTFKGWNEELNTINNEESYKSEIRHIESLAESQFKYDANIEILKSIAELKFLVRTLILDIKFKK